MQPRSAGAARSYRRHCSATAAWIAAFTSTVVQAGGLGWSAVPEFSLASHLRLGCAIKRSALDVIEHRVVLHREARNSTLALLPSAPCALVGNLARTVGCRHDHEERRPGLLAHCAVVDLPLEQWQGRRIFFASIRASSAAMSKSRVRVSPSSATLAPSVSKEAPFSSGQAHEMIVPQQQPRHRND